MDAALDRVEVEPHALELGAKAQQLGGELGGQSARVAQQGRLYVTQLLGLGLGLGLGSGLGLGLG